MNIIDAHSTTPTKTLYHNTDAIAEALIQTFDGIPLRNFDLILKATQTDLSKIIRCAALIKNQHFYEEAEWRLVIDNPLPSSVLHKTGRFGLTPYVASALLSREHPNSPTKKQRLLCSHITVGPRAEEDLSLLAADFFAQTQLHTTLEAGAQGCNIPFRTY